MNGHPQSSTPSLERTLVIVDDDPRIRLSLHGLFSSAGIRVRTYGSAADALNSGVLGTGSCLITDIRMPVMDGWELQRRVAEAYPQLPLIFVTAHQDEAAHRRAISSGAFALVYKPFDGEQLLRIVEAALLGGRNPPVGKAPTIVER